MSLQAKDAEHADRHSVSLLPSRSFLGCGGQLCAQLGSVTAGKTYAVHADRHSVSLVPSGSLMDCGGQLYAQLCSVTAGEA